APDNQDGQQYQDHDENHVPNPSPGLSSALCTTKRPAATMTAIMEMTTLLWVLGAVLVLLGLAGTVLPLVPGIPLMLAGMLLAAWAEDFSRIGWGTLVLLAVLTALSLVVEAMAAALGAKRVGASRAAILGAALGALFGFFAGFI